MSDQWELRAWAALAERDLLKAQVDALREALAVKRAAPQADGGGDR